MPMSELPILYSFRRCPYAMRARLALRASRQSCRLREVVLRDKPQSLYEASAKGTVPVLVLPEGKVLDESLDIMLWALQTNDPEHWLPTTAEERQAALALIAENDKAFKTRLDRYKYPNRYQLESGDADRDAAMPWLFGLNERLTTQTFLFGMQTSIADMAIAPFVRQFAHTDPDWFRRQAWPRLLHWLDAFLDSEAFAQVMEKYPPWSPEQADVLFPSPA